MRVVDLFAGSGGLSLGFQNAGFDVVAAFERWPAAAKCYRANFDHPALEIDLADVPAAVASEMLRYGERRSGAQEPGVRSSA